MAAKTSPQELLHLAWVLNREAARLDAVRDELHQLVRASRGEWEGTVADRFRGHTGAEHRQRHLEVAGRRLRRAANLLVDAAGEVDRDKSREETGDRDKTRRERGGVSGGGEG